MPTPPPLLPILLLALLHLIHAGNVLITPPFPPTAFLGQPYSIRFQGTGLSKPTFTFTDLPPFLKGFPNGTLTGTPTETGSFKVLINYADKTRNGTTSAIISVGDNNTEHMTLTPNWQGTISPLFLSFSDGSRTFRAGQTIDIGFQCINAVEPIAVSYNSLPDGLTGDNSAIQGSIQAPGLYTFSIFVGDAVGYRTQSFITLNIQPKDANITSTLVDVPLKNEDFNVDVMTLKALHTNAQNTLKRALQKAISAQNNMTMVQNSMYNSANNLVLAQQASLSFQKAYTDALQNLNSLQTFINNGATAIKANTLKASLANSSLMQANQILLNAQKTYLSALSTFQASAQLFDVSVASMAQASKASSDANNQYSQLSAAAISARNAFTSTSNNLQLTKQNKDTSQTMLNNANQVVPVAELIVQLANQDNDAANSNYKNALINVQISKNNTKSIETYIQEGRRALQQARQDLGVSKFNLMQADNNLFVAQSAKQVADKAIAIIVAQGFTQIIVKTSTTPSSSSAIPLSTPSADFKGCDNYAYPSMFGTANVVELLPNGAKTSGGHKISWGQCTKKSTTIRVGDQIYYEGNLIQSTINLWLLVNKSI